jgi:hypothetical protein
MLVVWLLIGAAVEVLNSLLRHWSVARLGLPKEYSLSGRRQSVFWLAVGFLLRVGVTSLILLLAFRQNIASGLAALVGYWICRWVMVWWVARRLSGRTSSGG